MSTPGSGPYEIIDSDGNRIGRALNETHDLAPKAIHAGTDDPNPIWDVERLDNKLYILGNRRAPTANVEGWLYALLENLERRTEWELVVVTEGVFQMKDSASGNVWTVPLRVGDGPVQISLEPAREGNPRQLFKLFWLD